MFVTKPRRGFGGFGGFVTDALRMGKVEERNLPVQQRREVAHSSGCLCGECSICFDRVCKELNFKCLLVLVLGFVVFVPGFFWLLPFHERNSGFEAKDAIKLSGMYVCMSFDSHFSYSVLGLDDLCSNFLMASYTSLMILDDLAVF